MFDEELMIDEIDEEFPVKEEINGSLKRKRIGKFCKERYKLLRMSEVAGYPDGGAGWADKDGNYVLFDDQKPAYLKRYYRTHMSKDLKKYCNRKLRRSNKLKNITSQQKGAYRKLTEFWWLYS